MKCELVADPTGAKLEAFVRLQKTKGTTRQESYDGLIGLLHQLNKIEPETEELNRMTEAVQDICDYVIANTGNPQLWIYPKEPT